MQELAFFVGKGGVGKSTVSAAYAIHETIRNPTERVLLLSTDPAHSLADVLEVPLGSKPTAVALPSKGKLFAWQIDAEARFRAFLREHKEKILQVVEMGSIFTRDDIEPLIDSTLPGMAEMSALLAIDDVVNSGRYSRIVVDTAPFGHTLRLLGLPEQFSRFLEFLELSAGRDQVLAAHFGGRAQNPSAGFLADWRSMLEGIEGAISKRAKLFLVTTAEKFSLNEAVRCRDLLAGYSPPVRIHSVVLNRVVSKRSDCEACAASAKSATSAHKFLKKNFRETPVYVGEDCGGPIMGAAKLGEFGMHVFEKRRLRPVAAPRARRARMRKTPWPTLDVSLSFVLGKGGVGKTTLSAGLGFVSRRKTSDAVQICSVDPAPSLDDVFGTDVDDRPKMVLGDQGFRASELDSAALFHQWVDDLESSIAEATKVEVSGIHVDLSFERRLLEQLLEIVPPGVDEVLAIVRIVDLLNSDARLLIDMAPTGHGLELLRMPDRILAWTRPLLKTLALHRTLAVAREAGVKIAELSHQVRELIAVLKDPKRTQVLGVMLPEPLPDRETERLLQQLRTLGLPARALFINRVVFESAAGKCPRCRAAAKWQQATLENLRRRHPRTRMFVVPNFSQEIAGKKGLHKLTDQLWELV